jgi:hypothetical protein
MSGRGPAGRAAGGWVALVVALAAIGLVLAASRSGRTGTITPVTTASPPAPAASLTVSAEPGQLPRPDGNESAPLLAIDAFLGLLLAIVLALFCYLGWFWIRGGGIGVVGRRRRAAHRPRPHRLPTADRTSSESLTEAVDAGLRRLDEGEPQDAVIACWVLLERAAAKAGTARRPSETPAELAARVLAEHRVSAEALDRLAQLYREARYSRHVLGEPARVEARTALERVRRELTGEVTVW